VLHEEEEDMVLSDDEYHNNLAKLAKSIRLKSNTDSQTEAMNFYYDQIEESKISDITTFSDIVKSLNHVSSNLLANNSHLLKSPNKRSLLNNDFSHLNSKVSRKDD